MTDPRTLSCRDYLASVGGTRHGRGATDCWFLTVPGGRRGRLLVEFKVGRIWNGSISVDRWGCRNAPPEAERWIAEHVRPSVEEALAHTRRWGVLPTGRGSSDSAWPVRSDTVPDLLRAWVGQELAWQQQLPPAGKEDLL